MNLFLARRLTMVSSPTNRRWAHRAPTCTECVVCHPAPATDSSASPHSGELAQDARHELCGSSCATSPIATTPKQLDLAPLAEVKRFCTVRAKLLDRHLAVDAVKVRQRSMLSTIEPLQGSPCLRPTLPEPRCSSQFFWPTTGTRRRQGTSLKAELADRRNRSPSGSPGTMSTP